MAHRRFYSLPLLIAGDHAGKALKDCLKSRRPRINWLDLGAFSEERTDYPDWAARLCARMQPGLLGVLICGSGQGMGIKANRYPRIRAALCWNEAIARLARAHNDANVLCLPARFLSPEEALKILDVFLSSEFDGHPVYKRRLGKLAAPAL